MIRYQARIMIDKPSGYKVDFPDLPGCLTHGKTKKEALKNAREALSLYIEDARDPTWDIPKAKHRKNKNLTWITPEVDVAIPLMIRQARRKQGLSQKQLAKLLGITFQQLQKLETPGKSNPTVKTLEAISHALNGELFFKLAA